MFYKDVNKLIGGLVNSSILRIKCFTAFPLYKNLLGFTHTNSGINQVVWSKKCSTSYFFLQ